MTQVQDFNARPSMRSLVRHSGGAESMIAAVRREVFERDDEYKRCARKRDDDAVNLVDYLFVTSQDSHLPHEVFDRLRWGGQLVFVSRDRAEVETIFAKYKDRRGFIIEREPAAVHSRLFGFRIPSFLGGESIYYFAARKILLIQPGQMTDRFTYDVRLVRLPAPRTGFAVQKQIPEFDSVVSRLRERLPDASMETIVKGARKLVDKVFPVFLTREAAFLSILRRDLPEKLRNRIPQIIDVQKDSQGFVKKLYLEWLRNGCEPMSQLEFARQSAQLLSALHDTAKVIHLDLRLDNFVVTERGVGFVDFGSAVRVGENLAQNPMIRTLFDEMMQTSQIQRDLGKMMRRGKVTSRMIVDSHQRVDKAVDLFYLALQIGDPHNNPDFVDLVRVDPQSEEAKRLAALTVDILKPADPERPTFKSAADIAAAIEKIHTDLAA